MIDKNELTPQDIESALYNLPPAQQEQIEAMAEILMRRVNARRPGRVPLGFGRGSALELLAKLGILLIEKKITTLDTRGGA